MSLPREGSRTARAGILVSTAMDWCWVDGKAVPFRVVARQEAGASTAGTVRLTGQAAHVRGSMVLSCLGDEAGVGGGVVSGTRGGVCEPKTFSGTVRFEGREAVRHDDAWWMNNRNTWGRLTYLGDLKEYPRGKSDSGTRTIEWDSRPPSGVTAAQGKKETLPASLQTASWPSPIVEAPPHHGGLRVSGRSLRSGTERKTGDGENRPVASKEPMLARDGQAAPPPIAKVRIDEAGSLLGPVPASFIDASPTLKRQLAELAEKGWTLELSMNPEAATSCNQNKRHIILSMKSFTSIETLLRSIAHEVGHALSPYRSDLRSREAFIHSELIGEGEAEINTMLIERELLAGGSIDIRRHSAQTPLYNQIYDECLAGRKTHAQALEEIGQLYARGETTGGMQYYDYYGQMYDSFGMNRVGCCTVM